MSSQHPQNKPLQMVTIKSHKKEINTMAPPTEWNMIIISGHILVGICCGFRRQFGLV